MSVSAWLEAPAARPLRAAAQLGFFALVWWGLTDGSAASWLIGLPAVGLTLALAAALTPPDAQRATVAGLLRFPPHFLWYSLTGGLDVARRALTPRLPLNPWLQVYAMRLPPGSAQRFFVNMVCLLPGTLSADVNQDRLLVHMLDQDQRLVSRLGELEQLVARLFALRLDTDPHREETDRG